MHSKTTYKLKLTFLTILSNLLATEANAICNMTSITPSAPDNRYIILSDGAEVLDSQTKLIWQRCSLGQTWNGTTCTGKAVTYTWRTALTEAKAVKGATSCRLPNIKELQSLREVTCYSPSINSTIFPNTNSDYYWSASPTTASNGGSSAWVMDFVNGYGFSSMLFYGHYVRAVCSN